LDAILSPDINIQLFCDPEKVRH